MTWKPLIVAVDGSPESVRAATLAAMIAEQVGTTCTPVHATPDYEKMFVSYGMMDISPDAAATAFEADRERVAASLKSVTPAGSLNVLVVRRGPPATVLKEEARRLGSGLIVIGNRRHILPRIGGPLAAQLLRTCDVPLLVCGREARIHRILAALDLSDASPATWEAAQSWAHTFVARLRALHVVEPMPVVPMATVELSEEYARADERLRETGVWASIEQPAEKVVRHGLSVSSIEAEVASWSADLLVLGSHGRGWAERLVLGSTTEEMVRRPACHTLVIPVKKPAPDRALDVGALPWEEEATMAAGAFHR